MKNCFWYAGKSSAEFGIYISGSGTYNAPEKDFESIEIPGRDGALILDNGRFKNIPITYPAFIRTKFLENSNAAKAWLLSQKGYQRLEDTYHPNHFRMAQFAGPLDFETKFLNLSGEMELAFNCKPQKYRKDGQYPTTFTVAGYLYNPELFSAQPIIKVYGNGPGTITIGGRVVTIKEIDEYVILDSDTQNAYKDTLNKNNTINAPEFPVLQAGNNAIGFSGGITKLEITPRWWTV